MMLSNSRTMIIGMSQSFLASLKKASSSIIVWNFATERLLSLIGFKFLLWRSVAKGHLSLFIDDEVFQNEAVHFRANKTSKRIEKAAHNRLASHVEGCVDEDGASCQLIELVYQIMEKRIVAAIDRLKSCRKINMRHGRDG